MQFHQSLILKGDGLKISCSSLLSPVFLGSISLGNSTSFRLTGLSLLDVLGSIKSGFEATPRDFLSKGVQKNYPLILNYPQYFLHIDC